MKFWKTADIMGKFPTLMAFGRQRLPWKIAAKNYEKRWKTGSFWGYEWAMTFQ